MARFLGYCVFWGWTHVNAASDPCAGLRKVVQVCRPGMASLPFSPRLVLYLLEKPSRPCPWGHVGQHTPKCRPAVLAGGAVLEHSTLFVRRQGWFCTAKALWSRDRAPGSREP